jgi:hypothetical protein
MANFNSPLGNKQFSGQQMREFNVPDDSGYNPPPNMSDIQDFQSRSDSDVAEFEARVKESKEFKHSGKERLNDGAKRRIEMLIGMTRTTREVDLSEGNVFILQTLKSKEMREAIRIAAEFDGTVQSPFEIRRQLLARSLTQVAGVEVSQFVGSNSLDAKLILIDDLDESLLNRLFDEYQKMVYDARDKFAIKDASDAEQVVEDLKK